MTWTQIEGGTYLISACLLTYRPLLERIGKKSFAVMPAYRKYSNGHNGQGIMRNGSPSMPLESGSKIRNLGKSSIGSSQVKDTPSTDPRILVTTEIHMKWNSESEV